MKKLLFLVSIISIFKIANADIEVDGQRNGEVIYKKTVKTDVYKDLNDIETVPIFAKEKKLKSKDAKGVDLSKDWQREDNFIIKEKNGKTSFYYGAGQPTVVCSPLQLCVIELGSDEKIVEGGVQIGDSARWQLDLVVGNNKKYNLILKPLDVGLKTSLVVLSDKRIYHINLLSRKTDFMARVGFRYPNSLEEKIVNYSNLNVIEVQAKKQIEAELNTEAELEKNHLDFDYKISDCTECLWKPIRVYNNGEQTFIQMNKSMSQVEAPALVVLGNDKKQEITNYRVHKNLYIVDKVFIKARLISGLGRNGATIDIEYKGFE